MSVLQATSAGVRDMSDGSLRITLEFDPRHAKDAYALFGARGTPCAIAALTIEAATSAAQQETIKEEKTKIGDLCRMAVMFCQNPQFQEWLLDCQGYLARSDEDCKKWILSTCNVTSRKDLDIDPVARSLFHRLVREPFLAWRDAQ
jgi:hypothetical protein